MGVGILLNNINPEMFFMINLISHSPQNEKILSLKKINETNFNWLTFLELAKKHHLTTYLAQKIEELDIDYIPSVILIALKSQISHNRDRNNVLCHELLKILNLLKTENIVAVPFKGPTLALQLYGNMTSRFSRDLDVLIQKQDMSKALQVLVEEGYTFQKEVHSAKKEQAYIKYNGQYLMFSPDGTIAVEPHTMFGPSTLSLNIDHQALWQNTVEMEFADQKIEVFKTETLFLILCVHGSKEKWRRLKWIIDVSRLLDENPKLDWQYILSEADKWGCLRMVYVAISLTQRIFNAPIPENIQQKIANERFVGYLVDVVEESLEDITPDLSSIYDISLFILSIRESNYDKIKYLTRTIFTPRDFHYELVDLPEALFFCYPLIKVIHDYLLLPLWKAQKFILRNTTTS